MEYYDAYPYMEKKDEKCKKRTLKVNGRGVVDAAPDMAVISAGVVTEDENAQNAQNQNDRIINNIIAALLQIGIPREDIQTQTYTIIPNYEFVEGQQILRGYRATHILEIKVRDIDQVGLVINTVTENGANLINRVEFTLANSARYYNRALRLAVADAASKAVTIAKAMRVTLDTVPCSVVEQSTSFTPFAEQTLMKTAALDVTMPGRIEISAAVEVEFVYY